MALNDLKKIDQSGNGEAFRTFESTEWGTLDRYSWGFYGCPSQLILAVSNWVPVRACLQMTLSSDDPYPVRPLYLLGSPENPKVEYDTYSSFPVVYRRSPNRIYTDNFDINSIAEARTALLGLASYHLVQLLSTVNALRAREGS